MVGSDNLGFGIPLHALVPREFERDACGLQGLHHIHQEMPCDNVSCEIERLIDFEEEVGHVKMR